MVYTPKIWQDNPEGKTPITASALNHLETQYDETVAYITGKAVGPGDSFVTTNAQGDLPASVLNSLGNNTNIAYPLGPSKQFAGALVDSIVITTFSAGHGWTLSQSGDGTVSEDLTTRGPFSDRSIALKTIAATPTQIQKTVTAVTTATGPLAIWFKFADGQNQPQGFEIRLTDATLSNGYAWTVYPKSPATENIDGWTAQELFARPGTVIGTPGTLNTIRIRPFANTTVNIGAIIQKRTSPAYPNGVITLRFDDGYSSQYTLGMPALAKYGYSASLVMIAEHATIPSGLTMAQLKELQQRAGWEIGAHAFTASAHDRRFTTLSADELEYEFKNLSKWLKTNGFDTSIWASPGGQSNAFVWAVGRKYFASQWGVSGNLADTTLGGYKNTPRPVYPAHVPSASFDVTSSSVAAMQQIISDVALNKTWATLTFHTIAPAGTASSGNVINVTDLETVLASISSSGVAVQTPNQIFTKANV